MLAPWCVLLDVEHPQAAELEHEDAHEQQREQRAAGAVLEQGSHDARTPFTRSSRNTRTRRKTRRTLTCGNGQAREQVGPAELAEEVPGLRRR